MLSERSILTAPCPCLVKKLQPGAELTAREGVQREDGCRSAAPHAAARGRRSPRPPLALPPGPAPTLTSAAPAGRGPGVPPVPPAAGGACPRRLAACLVATILAAPCPAPSGAPGSGGELGPLRDSAAEAAKRQELAEQPQGPVRLARKGTGQEPGAPVLTCSSG